jgi:hypothetical protein
MSSSTVVTEGPESWWESAVSGEVIDGLTDGVASRDDAVARAGVVVGIVLEMLEAVQWRCADRAESGELESLRRLVQAAEAHRERMRSTHDLVAVPAPLATAAPEDGAPG